MLALYLVRPEETDRRALVKYLGEGGGGLTRLGITKAYEAADALKRCGVAPDGIYRAPCAAAAQTAYVLARVLTKPRQKPVSVSELADVLPGENATAFELRLERHLAKFCESAKTGAFIFVVDHAVADALIRAWEGRIRTTPISLEQSSAHVRVLARD